VRASKLKHYLDTEIPRIAEKDGHRQIPEVVNGFPAAEEPIFGTAIPEINVEIRFTANRTGSIRLEGPDTSTVRMDDVSTGPWQLQLSNGIHVLKELTSGDEEIIRPRPDEGVLHVEF
jgi:hypothetical protein